MTEMTEEPQVVGLKMTDMTETPQIAVNIGDSRYDYVWKGKLL